MNVKEKLIRLIQENPDLPLLPMVDADVVEDNYIQSWPGVIADVHIEDVCNAWEIVFKREAETDQECMRDLIKLDLGYDEQGNLRADLLTPDEIEQAFRNLPWKRVIVIDIVPEEQT